jgi:hypothetical protein
MSPGWDFRRALKSYFEEKVEVITLAKTMTTGKQMWMTI